MQDNASGNSQGTDPGTRRQDTWDDDSFAAVIDFPFDDGSDGVMNDRGLVNVGVESDDHPDSTGDRSFSVEFEDILGDDDDDELPEGGADELGLGFDATSEPYGALDVERSPWAPLLDMLDSPEPEASPGDGPFTPIEGTEVAHALEMRAESIRLYAERGAVRTGKLDRFEIGLSDENRDVVAGRDQVEIEGLLDEHTGHGLVVVADDVEMNVEGPLSMHAHLEDNIIMAGVMHDEWTGGTFITAAMSDDMAAGVGLRGTAPLDVWVHGLVGMEERPGTCASDGILNELAGTLYEREYGPSAHVAAVARFQGTVATTMKTGFRPLMKTALGVRNLIPGGGGGGGQASASPPAAPPAPGGGEAAGAATLTAAEGGGALGRGVAGGGDTDEIITVVRTAESASDTVDVENLQHPASTADNLDNLARVDVDGEGYRQVGEIYGEPVPAGGWVETEDGELYAISVRNESLDASQTLDTDGAYRLADSDPDSASPLSTERHVSFAEPDGASASAAGAGSPPASGRPLADSTPPASSANPAPTPVTPKPKALDLSEPGTEGFDFGKSYHSLRDRQQYYRDYAKWPGNLALTESIGAVDGKAADLFQGLGGSLDDLPLDPTSRTLAIRAELDNMAMRAEAAGDADRLARIRGAIDELDVFVHDTAVDIAVRADEVPGQALGSQRVPLDADVDIDKLRSWFQEKLADAEARHAAAPAVADSEAEMMAQMLMGDEALYYRRMIGSLDKGANPLTESREMVAFHRAAADDYYRSLAEAAATGGSAPGSAPPQPLTVYKLNLYNELQAFLVAKLSDPQFMRSAAVRDVDLFAAHARVPLEAGLDLLEPDTLRLSTTGEVPPPLPAPSPSGHASGLDDARNASFSRSALDASEETLVRRVLDFGGLDVPGPSRQTSSGADSGFSGTPATFPDFGGAPSDNALPPVIEEQSGRWIVESAAEFDVSPATSEGVSPPAQRGGTSSQSSAVSWDSGLREAGDTDVSPVAGDAQTSDLFRPASEPVDQDVGEVQHISAAGEEGGDSSPGAASGATSDSNANPAGTVSQPTANVRELRS